MAAEEVCRVLGLGAGNLRVRLHRARLLLRACLERELVRRLSDRATRPAPPSRVPMPGPSRLLRILTLRCEGASALASQALDEPLGLADRLALWGHLLACIPCRRLPQPAPGPPGRPLPGGARRAGRPGPDPGSRSRPGPGPGSRRAIAPGPPGPVPGRPAGTVRREAGESATRVRPCSPRPAVEKPGSASAGIAILLFDGVRAAPRAGRGRWVRLSPASLGHTSWGAAWPPSLVLKARRILRLGSWVGATIGAGWRG